ncbi:hypothetical protein [Enterobacter hormaechei]
MATGKRKNQKESPEEELDRLLDELELTEEQREFIESMREDKGDPSSEQRLPSAERIRMAA